MQGLQLVAEWQPDAVLTDLNLPDLNGSELCYRIRSNPDWDNIAVIFHSGSQPYPHSDHDCDAFLTYPVETRELVTTIIGCITRKRRSFGSLWRASSIPILIASSVPPSAICNPFVSNELHRSKTITH